MTTVVHLIPGDRVDGRNGTFIHQGPHPIYPRMQLLVWVGADGTVHLDMAHPGEDIGPVDRADDATRATRLWEALPEHRLANANGSRR